MLDGIWRRWIKEYLPVISRQSKWFENVREIREGDLVLVVDGIIRNQWKKGLVERIMARPDGHIRQAWVRTNTAAVRRPVAKLALLEIATLSDQMWLITGGGMLGKGSAIDESNPDV